MSNANRNLQTAEGKTWPATGYSKPVQEDQARPVAGGGDHFEGYSDRCALCRGRARDTLTENSRRDIRSHGDLLT